MVLSNYLYKYKQKSENEKILVFNTTHFLFTYLRKRMIIAELANTSLLSAIQYIRLISALNYLNTDFNFVN